MQEMIKKHFPFKTPRKGQLELIEKIINAFKSGKKHVVLNAPTGWGKSVIAYTIIKYFGNGYILTSQKCLQEQYNRDLDIPYILGRNNYQCLKNPLLNCEMGACKGNSSKYCTNCPYLIYKNKCFNSLISNMNYSYFLSSNNNSKAIDLGEDFTYTPAIPCRSIIVCDECHNFENELINLCSLKLSEQLLKYLSIPDKLPHKNASDEKIFEYLFNKIQPSLKVALAGYKNQINGHKSFGQTKNNKEVQQVLQKYSTIKKILSSIKEINNQYKNKQPIIINKDGEFLEFKLLYATSLFNMYVMPSANRFLHMSATILNKSDYCKNLGLNENEVEYISVDAIFPIENRLIHYNPVGSMTYTNKEKTLPIMAKKIDELLTKYKEHKGIIHTTNYNIAQVIIELLKNSENGQRLVMPRGANRQEILNEFYESDYPLVLISPSLTEGLDLKDDLSRFCIICKVPYASLGDPWVKARMEKNNTWYTINAAQTLIQMSGRSIRSETDFCDTYILDSNFLQFAKNSFKLLPNWWKESVVEN